jgi:hypothetical protein
MAKLDAEVKRDARGDWLVLSGNGVTFPILVGANDAHTLRAMIKRGATFRRGSSQERGPRVEASQNLASSKGA